jgi:hypothetical protein
MNYFLFSSPARKGGVVDCNYSGILPQRHQDKRIILYNSIFNPDKSGLKLMSLRLINEKTPLFNLYSSSFWVFVAWWLNGYLLF